MKNKKENRSKLSQLLSQLLSISLLLLFPITSVFAHSGAHPVRYASVNGTDEGVCNNPTFPCKTIAYTVNQSSKGDKIHVAEGEYQVQSLDIFYLLSDMVELKGGYSKNFRKQDSNKHLTTIMGIPADFRERLVKRGFRLLQDSKGADIQLSIKDRKMLETYQKITSKAEGSAECINGLAATYECHNIDLQSHIPLNEFSSVPSSANDIWGFVDLNNQREYAIMGLMNATVVVDVTNPALPVEIGSVTGTSSSWRDVKVYQVFDDASSSYKAYAYVTTEAFSQGMQILDLTDLPNQVTLAATINEFSTAHNVYLANINYDDGTALEGLNPYIYVEGSNNDGGAFRVFDLVDPINPALVATAPSGSGYVHDATSFVITDDRTADCVNGNNPCELFIDFNELTVDIWDMTNLSTPTMLSSTGYSNASYTHSGWWSEDMMTIFIQDELDEQNFGLNTTMRSLDISDLINPQISGIYTGQTAAIDHNGFTLGNYYYMSNYQRGLSVIDVSDPTDMKDVAFFDSYSIPAANTANFNGAWGTYPYLPSGNILISDIEYGLFVVKLNENDGAFPGTENMLPTSSYTFSNNNLAVTFTDTSSDSDGTVDSWNWDLGDGNLSTAKNPSNTYAAAGSYTVSLTVTDNDGATGISTQTITVSDGAGNTTGGFTETALAPARGENLSFTIDVPAGATSLVVDTSGGTGDADLIINFGSTPTRSNNDCIQQGAGNTHNCTMTNPSEGTWFIIVRGTQASSGVQLDAYWFTEATVNSAPTAEFTFSSTDLETTFTDNSSDTDGSVTSWSWDFGDSNTSTTQNPSNSYAVSGSYSVSLTVTDNDGETNTSTQSVTVSEGGGSTTGGFTEVDLAPARGENLSFTIVVPADATSLAVDISAGTGDADLVINFGSAPTRTNNDCIQQGAGNTHNCTITNPTEGSWFIIIRGAQASSGVKLDAYWNQ
jgi:choice-of-anchor B domain-containing protein